MARLRVNLGAVALVSTVMVVLLFGAANFYWVHREITDALGKELDARALQYARGMAVQAAEATLLEDHLQLRRFLEETQKLDNEIAYLFLADSKGGLVAHTFAEGFPVELLEANRLPVDRDYMVRRIVDRQGRVEPVRDVVAPVAEGYGGYVHVGLKERLILLGTQQASRAVGGMVGVFILLGLAASLFFARLVTRPVERLAAASRRVNVEILRNPELSQAELKPLSLSLPGLETEVDRLAEEFRQMVGRLAEAHRRLDEAQKQLVFAERLSTIGTIAAGLAHELNNPLAGLRNCLRRIQRDPENREQLERYLVTMQESVERMQRVLRGLLDLARPRRPEVKEVSLEPLLERVVLLAGHHLSEAGVHARKEVHEDAARAHVDEQLLEQALLNLVLNAGDSLLRRQRQCDPSFSPELVLRAFPSDGGLCIEVRDNGVGVKPEDLPRLFDPFFTTKEPGQGTGLGLSIAAEVVGAHGGEISVDSRPGAGATFRILLRHESGGKG